MQILSSEATYGERRSRSALVVETEPPVRSLVISILSQVGFQVAEASDAWHALSLVESGNCFDLLVSEAQPGGLDGRALAESFKSACPSGRIILTSGDSDVDSAATVGGGGPLMFLSRRNLADRLTEAVKDMGVPNPGGVVLLADDEPVVRHFVEVLLTRAGYTVITAADGQEALDLSRACTGRIDLLLSDIVMPRMNGADLAENISRERPATRILLMSGNCYGVLPEHLRVNNFLLKPFASKDLMEKVHEVLERTGPSPVQ
jgi:DNA-binding NtrC family response regulator